jgi:uncharacterized protein YjbI with pentapeptide repeats
MNYLIILLLFFVLLSSGHAENPEITPDKFLSELKKGHNSINKDHVNITGKLVLPKDINSITLTNSDVEGIFIMNGVTVRYDANFEGTRFKKDAIFENSHFANIAGFHKAHFYNDVHFNSSYWKTADFGGVFDSDAVFTDINKNKKECSADFSGSIFHGPVNFNSAIINDAVFKNANFSKLANFEGSTLNNANFENAKFYQTADFKSVKGISNFRNSHFFQGANFEDSELNNADFENASFNQIADFESAKGISIFRNANFSGQANFEGSELNNANFEKSKFGQQADFSNAVFRGTAGFLDANFSGNLSLRGCEFEKRANFQSAFHGFVDLTNSKKINADFRSASFSKKSKVILKDSSFGENYELDYKYINQPLPCGEGMLNDLIDEYKYQEDEIRIQIGKCRDISENNSLDKIINGFTTYKTSIIPIIILMLILNLFVFPLIYYKERCLKKERSISECLLFSISSVIYGRDSESEMPSNRCKWIQTTQVALHFLLLGLIAIMFVEIYIK